MNLNSRTVVPFTWLAVMSLSFCVGCDSVSEEPEEIRIDTPEGEVITHRTTIDPLPQKISVVAGDELARLRSLADQGPAFVAHYVKDATDPGLKDYDVAFRAWQQDEKPPYTDQQVIEIVGGYLGNKLIADFDMQWVTVNDEYGTDYAVRGNKVEVMSFPFSTVLKRVEDQESDFVHGVYYALKNLIEEGDYKEREGD